MRWQIILAAPVVWLVACQDTGKVPFPDGKTPPGSTGGTSFGGSGGSGGSSGGAGGFGGSGGTSSSCSNGYTQDGCWCGPVECDPVSNSGCSSGYACDVNNDNSVQCFSPPNEQGLYDYCDNSNGPFCQGGLACWDGVCRQRCCSSDDCDPGEECVAKNPSLGTLGACQ